MLKLASLFAAAAVLSVSPLAAAQTYIAPASPAAVVPATPAAGAPVGGVVAEPLEIILQLHPAAHFGAARQVFVHGATAMAISGQHSQTPAALGPVTKTDALALNAQLKSGYFLTSYFAAGLTGSVGFSNNMLAEGVQLHIGPFVALNVPVHHHVSFFPSLAGVYGYGNNINKSAGTSMFEHDIELELQLTVLFHVAAHFSVSISPYANQVAYARLGAGASAPIERFQGPWQTSYGAKFGLLFWR